MAENFDAEIAKGVISPMVVARISTLLSRSIRPSNSSRISIAVLRSSARSSAIFQHDGSSSSRSRIYRTALEVGLATND